MVIPTLRRPELVVRAVESVLSQTLRDIEAIVVPASDHEITRWRLGEIDDERLRVLPFHRPLSASAARNFGVRECRGEWVAFLDDDDFWLPEKLDRQMAIAAKFSSGLMVVSCGVLARDGVSEWRWPRRLPAADESVGDYLFRRRSLFGGGGYFQTSTLLAPRRLLIDVSFREDLVLVEDLDWILRTANADVPMEFVVDPRSNTPQPLAVWSIDSGRVRESQDQSWRVAFEWIGESRHLVSPEAYASYLLTWLSYEAAKQQSGFSDFWLLLREAFRQGRPSTLDLCVHVGHWLVPIRTLGWLSRTFTAVPKAFKHGDRN